VKGPFSLNPKRVILFDLDGTLTYGVSTTRFIFRKMGAEDYFRKLEEDWLVEKTDHLTLAKKVTRRMKGWKLADIHKALAQIPKMKGIGETVKVLKSQGHKVALATLGYELSARFFQDRYGFDEVRGTTLEIKGGRVTGRGMVIFEEHGKPLFLKDLAKRHKVPLRHTAVLGDSRSDRAVFKVAGKKIAVNPDRFLKGRGDWELTGRDLRPVLNHL
jgi:phosphoserine phosphatase